MKLLNSNELGFARVLVYETNKDVEILGFGDFHIGATDFRKDLLFEIPEKFPNAHLILVGDYLDFALKSSIGNIYEATTQPDEQIGILDEFLNKYRERILGGVSGNHDYRLRDATGIDIVRLLFEKHRIPYFDTTMIFDINIIGKASTSKRRHNFSIAAHHGASGGRFPEKSARQNRYFKDYLENVDIFITGHTHQPNIMPIRVNHYDRLNKTINVRTLHTVVVPSIVPEEKYAQRKMLSPTPLVFSLIKLKKQHEKKINIETHDLSSLIRRWYNKIINSYY